MAVKPTKFAKRNLKNPNFGAIFLNKESKDFLSILTFLNNHMKRHILQNSGSRDIYENILKKEYKLHKN